jgi:transcriptional regulator with XRE-family HTH domain
VRRLILIERGKGERMPGRYGNTIRAARQRRGLTIEQVAEDVGMTPDGLSRIERGINGTTLSTLERIADSLNFLVGDLLPHSGLPWQEDLTPLLDALAEMGELERRICVRGFTAHARTLAKNMRELSLTLVRDQHAAGGD